MLRILLLGVVVLALVGCSPAYTLDPEPEVIVDDYLDVEEDLSSNDMDLEELFADDEEIEIGEMI